jgi:uncharacterized nucleotidyltransferase DUF6036
MSSEAFRAAPSELLTAFGRVMKERGWRWYVFGAQAVAAYGRPRLTADVDVTVDLAGAGPGDLTMALGPAGFSLRYPLSPEELAAARLLPMAHAPSAFPLDLVIAAPGLDEEFLSRARWMNLGGVEAPVVSVEDLLVMKVVAGRRKDLEDIRGILSAQREKIDFERLRDVLAALDAVDPERGLLAKLERLARGTSAATVRRVRPRR